MNPVVTEITNPLPKQDAPPMLDTAVVQVQNPVQNESKENRLNSATVNETPDK